MPREDYIEAIPTGPLGIIALKGCADFGTKVEQYIVNWRNSRNGEHISNIVYSGYQKNSYMIDARCPRFGSGEAKCAIFETVRGLDLYILVDISNYSITYNMNGYENHMSPDDHFQDLKRVIQACAGKAHRITVIMPFLYEGRQHKRAMRESLDCAVALQELIHMGVDSIITFDAHDPRVQNAIPLNNFDTIMPTYQFIKAILKNVPDVRMNADNLMVISPDIGGMGRAVYFAGVLGVDVGMFYKRRDYSTVVDGKNPIVAHEYLGRKLDGKDVIIVDDMISSGQSMIEAAKELKNRNAGRIFVACTFGLFTNGLKVFDEAYDSGLITKVVTTNLIYQTPELLSRPYYISADMSKYVALIIDKLNHDSSISELLSPTDRITKILKKYGQI